MTYVRLPSRRGCITSDFEHGNYTYTMTISRLDNGNLAEIFIKGKKPDSTIDHIVDDAAIAISKCLRSGCPEDKLRKSLKRGPNGKPLSPLGAALDLASKL